MEKKIKKKVTFQKVLSIITDILIYPIIALAIFSSFVMLNAKRDNEVYAIFGYSIVKILSGSMTASGFEKDDLVILHSVNTDDLRVGDDIAFSDVSVVHDDSGRPELLVAGGAKSALKALAGTDAKIHLSITDQSEYCAAMVVIETK